MLRAEIVKGIAQLRDAVRDSGIAEVLDSILPVNRQRSPKTASHALAAVRRYAEKAAKFNDAARQIANAFELKPLEDSETWVQLIVQEHRPNDALIRARRGLYYLEDFLPKFAKILLPERLQSEHEKSEQPTGNKSVISFVLIEEGNQTSRPERIVTLLTGVATLYGLCATLEGLSPDTLAVIGCDSGSDKAFDFLGVAKGIECLRGLIIDIWDRVLFHREKTLLERARAVSATLPVLERVNSAQAAGTISPEQGEILRRSIEKGVSQFLEAGATTAELENYAPVNPRLLLAPERKLLAAPADQSEQATAPPLAPPKKARQRKKKATPRDTHRNETDMSAGATSRKLSKQETETLRTLLKKLEA